jgi:RimJ/RimL family protein N-acetyltransferase
VFAYASDPEVTRYMDWVTHASRDDAVAFLDGALERRAAGTETTWMMTVPPDDGAIGVISCRMRGHAADFGYALDRRYWGRGYTTEAARAVVGWASGLEHVHRVWATCDVENVASARVLEKAGLQREGVLRCWSIKPNIGPVPRHSYMYARIRGR